MKYLLPVAIALTSLSATAHARPFTPGDMASLNRLSAPAVWPDGKWVAYVAMKRPGGRY